MLIREVQRSSNATKSNSVTSVNLTGNKRLSKNLKAAQIKKANKKKLLLKTRSLALVHNLAPSCYQHPVRVWRLQYENSSNGGGGLADYPTSDGYLGPPKMRKGFIEDAAAAATTDKDIEAPAEVAISTPTPAARRDSEFVRPSEFARDSMIGGPNTTRDSMLPMHLFRITFSAKSSNNAPLAEQSVAPDQPEQQPPAGATKKIANVVRNIMGSSSSSANNNSRICFPFVYRAFNYAYYNKFFISYFFKFMMGGNAYPVGPKYFRPVYEALTFVMCLADLALWVLILINTWCASENSTLCQNHTSFYLVIGVWPAAFMLAPLLGISTVMLGPSGILARVYALYSRLAAFNNLAIILITFHFFSYYNNVDGSYYTIVALTASRAFQCLFVDLYIAHIEKLRYTRGWDGLHTTLFPTKDNKQEVNG
jgi:hypothetical protein